MELSLTIQIFLVCLQILGICILGYSIFFMIKHLKEMGLIK